MDYLHIKSLEDYHPGYKDRKLQWCKAYFTMLNADPDIEMLCEIDKWRFLAFIMLELQMQKPVPLNDEWLVRKGFNIEIRPISLTLQMLHNFIEVYPTQSEMRVLDKSRVDKSIVRNESNQPFINAVIEDLNKQCSTSYKPTSQKTRKYISARIREGFKFEDFQRVHRIKCAEWKGTDMEKYLRPETLYGTKFESYLNQKEKSGKKYV
jgi:uncharacterized phage protein (TIGR02220 family)